MTDEKIVELYGERSEEAIKETDKQYGRYFHYIAKEILQDEEDAKEIVNDTYLKAWNSIPPERPNPLKAFLGRITRQLSLNRLEQNKAQKRGGGQYLLALDELAECIPDGSGSEDLASNIDLTDAINRFLRSLPIEQRRVFIKRYWYGKDKRLRFSVPLTQATGFLPAVETFRLEELPSLWYNRNSKQTEDIMRDYSFGNFLHELRSRRGLTQYQLGALVGVSDKAVSKWENGSSKPQSNLLYKLSEVLGIHVDELLTCQYHSFEKKDTKGVLAMKKQLWNQAFDAMRKRYGNPVPIEIMNRFLTEHAEMKDTDMIVYFDMLSVLATEAKKQGEHIRVGGGTGASFVAYLLEATEVNPLKPHYFCPACRAAAFGYRVDDGWDLPKKICSCGKEMHADGHSIPFEAYRPFIQRNTSFHVSVSPAYLPLAKTIVQDYFEGCNLTIEEREPNKVIAFMVSSHPSACTITLCADEEFTRYPELERATATCFERVPFASAEILKEFRECHTEGITEFKTDFVKNRLRSISPQSFHDLIQVMGLTHGTGVWFDNGEKRIENGCPVADVIAYRDDVFTYIQEKMMARGLADTGFAYKIMEDTRRGVYAKNGVPEDIRLNLNAIGIENWFVDSIGKIRYLFPKAHGVAYVKLAATLMWYKIHYPKEFHQIQW